MGKAEDTLKNGFHASLYVILDALQWSGDKSYIARVTRGTPDKMGLNDLLNSLAVFKIEGKRVRSSLEDIHQEHLPCLIMPKKNRPFVITQEKDGKLIAYDTDEGAFIELPRSAHPWDLIRFVEKEREDKTLLDRQEDWFFQVLMRFKIFGLYILSLSFVINMLNIFAPLLVIVVFQQIAASKSLSQLTTVLQGLGIYLFALILIRLIRGQILNHIATRLGYIIGSEVMRRILYLASPYTEAASASSQLSRIKDFDTIQQFIPSMGTDALLDLPFTMLVILALFLIAGPLALVPFGAVLLFCVVGMFLKGRIKKISLEAAKTGKERYDFIMDSLNSLEQLQAQYLLPFWKERYAKISMRASKKIFESGTINSLISSLSYFIVTASGIVTVIVGVHMVEMGSLDSGRLMASMLLTWKILAPLRNGFSFAMQINKVKNSIQQVDRLINLPMEYLSEEAFFGGFQLKGQLSFQQVSLKYSTDAHPALLGVSFTVERNETLVILGHGGSGQTSIFKLILGLYFPQAGRVLIDNYNTRQIDPVSLRHQIAYMPEHAGILGATIRETLMLLVPGADPKEIEEAMMQTGLRAEIDALPEGLDTKVDKLHEGSTSASFFKRLTLTAMFLKKSQLWLLDNPGFGLEDFNERELLSTLNSMRGKATVVIATQNTEYINICDKVLWLNAGRVQFFGTPQDLMKQMPKAAS